MLSLLGLDNDPHDSFNSFSTQAIDDDSVNKTASDAKGMPWYLSAESSRACKSSSPRKVPEPASTVPPQASEKNEPDLQAVRGLRAPDLEADIAKAVAAYSEAVCGPQQLQAWPFPSTSALQPKQPYIEPSTSTGIVVPPSMKLPLDLHYAGSARFSTGIKPINFFPPPSLPTFPSNQLGALTPRRSTGKANQKLWQPTSPRGVAQLLPQPRPVSVLSDSQNSHSRARSVGRCANPAAFGSEVGRPTSAWMGQEIAAPQGPMLRSGPKRSSSTSCLSARGCSSSQVLVSPTCSTVSAPRSLSSSLSKSLPSSRQVSRNGDPGNSYHEKLSGWRFRTDSTSATTVKGRSEKRHGDVAVQDGDAVMVRSSMGSFRCPTGSFRCPTTFRSVSVPSHSRSDCHLTTGPRPVASEMPLPRFVSSTLHCNIGLNTRLSSWPRLPSYEQPGEAPEVVVATVESSTPMLSLDDVKKHGGF